MQEEINTLIDRILAINPRANYKKLKDITKTPIASETESSSEEEENQPNQEDNTDSKLDSIVILNDTASTSEVNENLNDNINNKNTEQKIIKNIEIETKDSNLNLHSNSNNSEENSDNSGPNSENNSDEEQENSEKMTKLSDKEVEEIMKNNFPSTFSGDQSEIPQIINILKYLIAMVSHDDNQNLLITQINLRLKGIALAIAQNCKTVGEILEEFQKAKKGETPEELIAKMKLLKNTEDFNSKVEDLANKLKASYISQKQFSLEQADYLVLGAARDVYIKAIGTNPANINALRSRELNSVGKLAEEFNIIQN